MQVGAEIYFLVHDLTTKSNDQYTFVWLEGHK